ncbi:PAS sensor protein [Halobacteriales archaeon QS_4_62_28]|nr:MAG: PAS sensor protein [Halobacteriales archaeon QS_4_62_28]
MISPDNDARSPGTNRTDGITVLCIGEDTEYLAMIETAFEDTDRLSILIETEPSQALDRLDGVDCVLSEYCMTGLDGIELLDAIRQRVPDLPFVLHDDIDLAEVSDRLFDRPKTDFQSKEWDEACMRLLSRRITLVVEYTRFEATANRLSAAVETSREATLVVDPDGTIAFVNDRLAAELPDDLLDGAQNHWEALFTDESVTHLQTDAFPVAADGWNWTGQTVLHTRSDGDATARTTLSHLDDGSIVFVFHRLDRATGESS